MKKGIIILSLFLLVMGCKSKETVVSTKLDNKTEAILKGNWQIATVSFAGSDYLKVTSFNIADSKCFEGSEWQFISNNNKGTMFFNKANCPSYSSALTWYVNKEGFMVVKFLTEGVKAKHTVSGYVLKLVNVSETSFQLVDKVNVGGKMVDLTYNFIRK